MTAYYLCSSLTGALSGKKAKLFLYDLLHFSIPYQVYPVDSVKKSVKNWLAGAGDASKY